MEKLFDYSSGFLILITVVVLLLLWFGWKLRIAWRNFLLYLNRRKGKIGEQDAVSLLEKKGYKIIQSELPLSGFFYIDDEPSRFNVRADYLVERDGRKYLAEVKTGLAARANNSTTRRQLLEYASVTKSDTILLVDATAGKIQRIRFEN